MTYIRYPQLHCSITSTAYFNVGIRFSLGQEKEKRHAVMWRRRPVVFFSFSCKEGASISRLGDQFRIPNHLFWSLLSFFLLFSTETNCERIPRTPRSNSCKSRSRALGSLSCRENRTELNDSFLRNPKICFSQFRFFMVFNVTVVCH